MGRDHDVARLVDRPTRLCKHMTRALFILHGTAWGVPDNHDLFWRTWDDWATFNESWDSVGYLTKWRTHFFGFDSATPVGPDEYLRRGGAGNVFTGHFGGLL